MSRGDDDVKKILDIHADFVTIVFENVDLFLGYDGDRRENRPRQSEKEKRKGEAKARGPGGPFGVPPPPRDGEGRGRRQKAKKIKESVIRRRRGLTGQRLHSEHARFIRHLLN